MNKINIENRLLYKAKKNNAFETHLQAYIMQNFDSSPLSSFMLNDKESPAWIGNEVSCGVGMQRIDTLIIEETKKNIHIRIVEIKDEAPYSYIVDSQLPWYIEWVSDYVVPNYSIIGKEVFLYPCIVARHTNDTDIFDKIKQSQFNIRGTATVKPTEYISFVINDTIKFDKII
jgi:hypothetical protein